MKCNQPLLFLNRGCALLAALTLLSFSAKASPYATSLTNNAGTVSFRLNQTTTIDDSVWVISSAGAVTNILQLPGTTNITRGLIVTNLGIAAGPFQVRIKHIGSGAIATNSPRVSMGAIRGLAANVNPTSPYFGWVYASDSATNSNSRGDGIFAFSSDLSDITGQGNAPRNGGYTGFGSSTTFSPYKISVAPDDRILVCDDSDATANLISLDPLLTAFSYVLKPIQAFGGLTGAAPVGSNNVHGSLASAVMVGTGASRVLYTMDEDYQRDPTSGASTEWNSVWRYDIGATTDPWSNAPNRIIFSPFLTGFAGQNQGIQYHQFGSKHYLYASQRRSNPPQHTAYIVDLDNLPDPSTYGGNSPYGHFWASQDESLAEGYSDDVLRDMNQMTVSPDGRWFAGIIAGGSGTITAPDGSTFTTAANDLVVIPITNGVPNLPARQVFRQGGAGNGRDVAFDAANNLYSGSSGLGVIQSFDLGESTDITTGSDGTFFFATPPTQVSVTATTPLALEEGTVPGTFTITRTADDIGNPMKIVYNVTGSATNGGDYVTITNNVTIAAGQLSTNITITPIDDAIPEPTETVSLTLIGAGGYSVGFPNSATIFIVDNETPQLQILGLSTNIYEGLSNDYAGLVIRRLGATNVPVTLDANSFSLGGTAISNVDYYLPNLPITIPAGVVNYSNAFIYPINASTAVGAKTISLTMLAGTGYTVTNNTAAATLQLKAASPGTVLFSDNFETDPSGSNWNVIFASYTNTVPDYNVVFGYDYTSGSVGNLTAIPAAPHSTNGDTKGLYMTVNKSDGFGIAAGLNLYLKNHTFGSNYALRFDMYLVRNSSSTAQSKTECATFGINHSGNRTNWFRNAQTGTDLPGSPTASDGLWFDVGADGSSGSGSEDFGFWSSPTYTNTAAVIGPTNFILLRANAFTQIFKQGPYDASTPPAGIPLGGAPANTVLSPTPTWAEVEVSQLGNLITWKINNSVIGSFVNTNIVAFGLAASNNVPYTNGTIMLGYDDPWDDIGNATANSGEGCVIYDNVRVVAIAPPAIITQPSSIVALPGTATNLTVVVSTTTGTTNYQWQRFGTNLPGATSDTLSFPSLAFADFGTYRVIVGDGAYSIISSNVTVLPPVPGVLSGPSSIVAAVTTATNLSAVVQTFSGVTNLQWYLNNTLIPTATTNPFNFIVRSTNYGFAKLTVSDGYNVAATSAVVTVTPPTPLIITPPVSRAAVVGSAPSFSVVAQTFSGVTNYQWMYYATNITGTAATLTLANVQPVSFGGPFTVRVGDGTTFLTSSPPATLTFAVPQTLSNSVSGTTLTLRFGSEFGPAYVVEYKTNLTDASWKPLITNAGTGGAITVTDSLVAAPTRFYRIRLQ